MSIDIAKPSDVLPVIPVHVFNYLCSTASEWICRGTLIFWSWHNDDRLKTGPTIWKKDEKLPMMHVFPRKKNWNMLFLLFCFKAFCFRYIFTSPMSDEWRTLSTSMRCKQSPTFGSSPNRFSQIPFSFCSKNQSMQQ
jgi:hypothetical protein